MSCGLCAEACPFDAIKMDQDYEVAAYERYNSFLWNLDRLIKSEAYDNGLHPSDYGVSQDD
jgi:NADH-quinone oxidoreductase subunit I